MTEARARRAVLGAALAVLSLQALAAAEAIRSGGDGIREHLYDAAFVTTERGLAVGTFGAVFATDDGGRRWRRRATPVTEPLFAISFADEQAGWVSGAVGVVLRTSDGGESWLRQETPTSEHLFAIDFHDRRSGVAVGDWGVILVTADGGETWRNRSLGEDVMLYDCEILPDGTIWIVGEGGRIYRSRDGGFHSPAQPVESTLFALSFRDASRGVAVGLDGAVVTTDDGGRTWSRVAAPTNRPLYEVALRDAEAWAAGDAGAILRSTDAGATWSVIPVEERHRLAWFHAIALVGGRGIVAGANGTLLFVRPDGTPSIDPASRP